jgi:hypothetical protein
MIRYRDIRDNHINLWDMMLKYIKNKLNPLRGCHQILVRELRVGFRRVSLIKNKKRRRRGIVMILISMIIIIKSKRMIMRTVL